MEVPRKYDDHDNDKWIFPIEQSSEEKVDGKNISSKPTLIEKVN